MIRIICGLLLVMAGTAGPAFGRTRADVIADAAVYADFPWTPTGNNLLDATSHYAVIGTTLVPPPGQDGRDDRAFRRNTKTSVWEYSAMYWPFIAGQEVHGEAYAFGFWDSTSTFEAKLELNRIVGAGQADSDVDQNNEVDIAALNRFAGLDCSGFVSLLLNSPSKYGTAKGTNEAPGLPDIAVRTSTADLKSGDYLLRYNPGHVVVFSRFIDDKYIEILQAGTWRYSEAPLEDKYIMRIAKEITEYKVEERQLYLRYSSSNGTSWEAEKVAHYAHSPFPQFKWSSPAADYALLDAVDNAVALRIDSARALTKVEITLDPGTESSATAKMMNDGLYLSTVPASSGKGFEVSWRLPASFVLTEGTHTLVAYAMNNLGLEDWATTYFYVGADDIPPVIAWEDAVNLVPATGYVSGLRPPEAAPWFHGDLLKFELSDYQSPLSSFTIYSPSGEAVYSKEFLPGTKSAGVSEAIEHLPDATGYRAELLDSLGNGTTLYFHIDRSTPLVALAGIVSRIKPDLSGHLFDISGTAADSGSGLGGPVMDVAGSSVVTSTYCGPSWPVGPSDGEFSFTGSTDSRKLAVFDRSGWLGINTLGISTATNYANLEYPGTIFHYEQSGLILKRAAVRVYVPENIRLLNAPEGTVVTVSVLSAPPPADAAALPITYAFPYDNPGPVIAADSAGTYAYNGPRVLSSSVAVRLDCAYNTNAVNFMEKVDTNGDGTPDTEFAGTYPPGSFRLSASATVYFDYESLYELPDQDKYLEAGAMRTLQLGTVNVGIRDVTQGGRITIERGRHMVTQPGYKMAESGVVYEIKTDAVYTGLVTIKMGIGDLYWEQQRKNAKITHCDAAMHCVEVPEENTSRDEGSVIVTVDHLSPFALMVPVYDATPPHTDLAAFGVREELGGRVWITTETYVSLAPTDSANHDDISGPATTYFLINAEPAPACLTAVYNEGAAPGTCANPVYNGSFTLAEGSHTIHYMSSDNWGNIELPKADTFHVDGTPPATAVFAATGAVDHGGTAYITEADSVTIASVDPESNSVASGVDAVYRLVDVTPEECESEAPPAACASAEYSGPFALPIGTHTVYYSAVDKVGNRSPIKSVFIHVQQGDVTPPVSSATLSGIMGRNGWHTSAVGVSFSAVDDSTGVAGTYYSLDGGPFAPVPAPGTTQPPAGWAYGERLRITERGGSALSAYQTLLALDTAELVAAGKLRPDCADLRFYAEGAALSHWLEGGCGSAQTRVWLKVPELPAGGSVDVSMAYGNPSAASVSNGPAVFDFYDDFNDNSIDTLRWRTVPGACPMLERNGRLEFAACSTGSTLNKPWMVPLRSMPIKYVMETDVYGMNYGGDNAQAQIIALRWDGNFIGPNNPANGYILATFTGGSPMGAAMLVELAAEYGARTVLTVDDVFQPAHWQKLGIADDALGLDLYVDGAKIARYATENRWGNLWALSGRDYPYPSSVYYDNFRLRKYAAAEPAVERGAAGAAFVVSAEGGHAVRYYSEDLNGNREAERTLSFKIDRLAPEVAAAGSPARNAHGWNKEPVRVGFTGSDQVSGVEYCSPDAWLAVEGSSRQAAGYCADYAGHSSTAVYTASIDTTAPVITYNLPAAGSGGWYNAASRLKFACADALSGLKACSAGGTFDAEGINLSTAARAEDYAGNIRELLLDGLKSDNTPPATSAFLSGAAGRGGAYLSTVTVSLSASDWHSGVRAVYYRLDEGAAVLYTGPFGAAGEGGHTLEHFAVDNAGNAGAAGSVSFFIDSVAPVSSAVVAGAGGSNGWYGGDVTVGISAADAGSGVESVYYSVDGGSLSALAASAPVPAGWSYGERLRVTERSSSALSGYQLLVKLDTAELIAAGRLRPDCGDLRFYAGGTALNYWLEGGCNGAETRVWVKVPALPASGSVDLALVYGNPAAASVSYGPGVFDFYDDFNDNSIDTLRWRTVAGACPMAERNGRLEFSACSTGDTLTKPWMVPLNSMPEKYIMETDVYGLNYGGDNAQAQIIALRWDGNFVGPNNPVNGYILATFTGGSPMGAAVLVDMAAQYGPSTVVSVDNVFLPARWHRLGITDDAQGLSLYVDGSQLARYETANRGGYLWALSGRDYPSPSSVYYDNFRLRKYAAVEPSVERGAFGGTFVVTGDGFHAVRYHAEDRAGNAEAGRLLVFNISSGGAPAASSDGAAALAAGAAGISVTAVSTETAPGAAPAAAVAAATAGQGVEAVSAFYELEPSGVQFEAPVKLTFIFDPSGVDLGTVGIYYFDGVAWTSAPVTGQTTGLLADGRAYVAGFIAHTSLYAAMRAVDTRPPSSALEAAGVDGTGGERFVTGAGGLRLTSVDDLAAPGDRRGFGVQRQFVGISTGAAALRELEFANAEPGLGLAAVSTFTLSGLADGRYQVAYRALDVKEHLEAGKILAVTVDNAAPETAAAPAGAAGRNGWYVSSVTVSLAASDAGAGVAGIYYQPESRDPAPEPVPYTGPYAVEEEGPYKVYFHAVDRLGNAEAVKTAAFGIDLSTPVVAASAEPPPNAAGWNNAAVFVTFTGTDSVSGIDYCVAGATASAEGAAQAVSGYCLDRAGWSSTATVRVNIDTTAPGVDYTLSPAANAAGWHKGDVSVKFSCADGLSGVGECPPDILLSGEGVGVSTSAAAYDRAGNIAIAAASGINIDRTAPVSRAVLSGASGNGWYNSPVEITLVSTDALSGVERADYALESGGVLLSSGVYAGPAAAGADGEYLLSYYATDKAGNSEAALSAGFKLDRTPPQVGYTLLPAPDAGGWNNTDVTVVFSGTDTLSGVAECSSVTVHTEGAAQSAAGWCRDAAGNTAYAAATLNIDLTKPAIAISSPAAGAIYVATRGGIDVLFGVRDNLDPAPAAEAFLVEIEDRGGPRGGRPDRIAVGSGQSIEPLAMDDGVWRLTVAAADFAGNTAVLNGGTFEVVHDVLAPRTAQAAAGGPALAGATTYITADTALRLTSMDDLAQAQDAIGLGVKGQHVSLRSGGSQVNEAVFANPAPEQGTAFVTTFTVAAGLPDGFYSLGYGAEDVLGNMEAEKELLIGLDNTAPAAAAAIAGAAGGSGWHISTVTVSLSASDAMSGVAGLYYQLEHNGRRPELMPYTAPLPAMAEGIYKVYFYAVDRLGNTGEEAAAAFSLDLTAPQLSAARTPLPNAHGWNNTVVTVSFTCADALSGVQACAPAVEVAGEGFGQSVRGEAFDYAGNRSSAVIGGINIDKTPPVSAYRVEGIVYNSGDGRTYLSPASKLALSAGDPVSGGAASGVEAVEYYVDPGAFAVYSSSFVLPAGSRVVHYRSRDRAGNEEPARSVELNVDGTGPVTVFGVSGAPYAADGAQYLTPASLISLAASDPAADGAASGVLLTKYRLDGGNWLVYAGSVTIPAAGPHTLDYYSLDNVQNAEAPRSLALRVDDSAPVCAISLGEPMFEAFGLPVITPETPVALTAADPDADGAASGVKAIYYELTDAAGWSSGTRNYTEPFRTARQGTFTVRYWAADNVGNTGAPGTARLRVSGLQNDALGAVDGLDMSGSADIAGAVRSNAAVTLTGSARVLGDVYASTITSAGKAQITGQRYSGAATLAPAPLDLDDMVIIASHTNSNGLIPASYLAGGRLVVSAKAELTLSTGVYYFTGIELGGGAKVGVSGKVDILVAGDILIGGGASLNAAGSSSQLKIFLSTPSAMAVSGGGSLAAYVYAPYTGLTLGGNALLGGHYFVKRAALNGAGNVLQAGEALPRTIAAAGDEGGRKKASAMAGGAYEVLAGPDPAFRLGEVYVFPNPALRGAAPVFHVETGVADRVRITVYTVSGRQAHEHALTGMPAALDDGNGLGYAYEYTWRDSIPSGVYYYHIEAEKGGQKLKKSGKFAVVR